MTDRELLELILQKITIIEAKLAKIELEVDEIDMAGHPYPSSRRD